LTQTTEFAPVLTQGLVAELQAFANRLEQLSDREWELPTRVANGSVLDVANRVSEMERRLVVRLGDRLAVDAPHGEPSTTPAAALEAVHAALEELTEVLATRPDLDDLVITDALVSAGLHRNDLLNALAQDQALPDLVAVTATRSIPAMLAACVLSGTARHPEWPLAFRLATSSNIVNVYSLGTGWSFGRAGVSRNMSLCEIHGDDSSMALFVTGRIPVNDLRLWVTGVREPARAFKEYFPGQ
jgi:hypothetical protein